MQALHVGHYLSMDGTAEHPAAFAKVDLTRADIGGELDLTGATVDGKLSMRDLKVGQDLKLQRTCFPSKPPIDAEHPAVFADVDLTGADIGGNLDLTDATVDGKLSMRSLKVGQDLTLQGTCFPSKQSMDLPSKQPIDLTFATIKGNLDLSGCDFTDLDLSEASIESDLRICKARANPQGRLVLRNAHAGVLLDEWDKENQRGQPPDNTLKRDLVRYKLYLFLQWCYSPHERGKENQRVDWPDNWPNELQLDGFIYDRLGAGSDGDMLKRDLEWYKRWLRNSSNPIRHSPTSNSQMYSRQGGPAR